MEWLTPLLGQTVGLDSAPLIYFIERHPLYLPVLQPFFEGVDRGDIEIVTSAITLTEVLVHPLRHGNQQLAREYASILINAAHVRTMEVTPSIATEAAYLRAKHGYKTPDAIQLATAQSVRAAFFVTNDLLLTGLGGIQVVALKQLVADT